MAEATVTVEIAFSTDPAATPTWTDVSSYVRGFEINRGKQRWLDRFETGTARVLLDNSDRRFDPAHTTGPYYPNVKPMRRIRISAVHSSTTYRRFHGFIEEWPQTWPGHKDALVVLRAVDAFEAFSAMTLPSFWHAEVVKDDPEAWWRLGESTGTVAVDSTGNDYSGTYFNSPTLGATGLVSSDTDTAVTLDGTNYMDATVAPAGGQTLKTVELWINTTQEAAGKILEVETAQASVSGGRQVVGLTLALRQISGASWGIKATAGALGNPDINGATRVNDGQAHHIAVLITDSTTYELFVDNVSQGSAAYGEAGLRGKVRLGKALDASGTGFVGTADDLVLFQSKVSSARLTAHFDSGDDGFDGDASGARLGRILDAIGWPSADRDIDTGQTTMTGQSLGSSVMEGLRACEAAENGFLFIDDDGRVVFLERHAVLKSPYTTVQSTFGDGGGAEIEYHDLVLDNPLREIVTIARASRKDGPTVEVRDGTAVTTFLERVHEQSDLLIGSDNEARDAAQWVLAHFKDPLTLIRKISFRLGADSANAVWAQVLTRELMDRVKIIRRPPGGGSSIQQEAHILGMEISAQPRTWQVSWWLSPADTQSYLTLDDATLGKLDSNRLAY